MHPNQTRQQDVNLLNTTQNVFDVVHVARQQRAGGPHLQDLVPRRTLALGTAVGIGLSGRQFTGRRETPPPSGLQGPTRSESNLPPALLGQEGGLAPLSAPSSPLHGPASEESSFRLNL